MEILIGFKNGFCVIDFGCIIGFLQYGCNNMGIMVGCYDIYSFVLECQWIDVIDVLDGCYIFVICVNWDNVFDKLGCIEKDIFNNWVQVCIFLDCFFGSLEMSFDEECDFYIDCEGIFYGNVVIDCEGNCGGIILCGDFD